MASGDPSRAVGATARFSKLLALRSVIPSSVTKIQAVRQIIFCIGHFFSIFYNSFMIQY